MEIGDKVHVVGVVKDMVGGSVLVQTDPVPTDPGREYWFLEPHVLPHSETAPPAETPPAVPAQT